MEMHTHASLRAIHGFDADRRTASALVTWLSSALRHMQDTHRRQRDYAVLLEKTERELTDIGLTRADVTAAVKHGTRLTRKAPGNERC